MSAKCRLRPNIFLNSKICLYFSGLICIFPRYLSNMTLESLDKVPDVEIDPSGVFKYILIRVYAKQTADGNEPSKMIVRGNARGPYHGEKNMFISFKVNVG